MGVYQYEIPGVIELENGAREAVVIHLYLKGLQTGNVVTYRGSMFAESAEWEWYNWGGTGLCQPQITANWWPRVFFRCAPCCCQVHALHAARTCLFQEARDVLVCLSAAPSVSSPGSDKCLSGRPHVGHAGMQLACYHSGIPLHTKPRIIPFLLRNAARVSNTQCQPARKGVRVGRA